MSSYCECPCECESTIDPRCAAQGMCGRDTIADRISAAGRGKVVTVHVFPPIPTRDFDWQASFDSDEPNDDGQMLVGRGKTEQAAILDLLDEFEAGQ